MECSSHLNQISFVARSAPWSDPVCHGCDQLDTTTWSTSFWYLADTANWVASQWAQLGQNEVRWD